MITSASWRGKRYAVLGLARSGAATLNAFLSAGAKVTAWDASADNLTKVKAHFGAENDPPGSGITFVESGARLTFADPLELDLTGFAGVVVSPGVPIIRHPIREKAATAHVPLIGDIELFAEARTSLPPHKVVGITGTNGKSTTTALIHHIVEAAGIPTRLGGNIGLPILGQDPLPAGGVYVLELSSYQIDLTHSLDCDVAVLLNITPDHLDRYAGFDAYAASKARLFGMQSPGHAAIIGIGDAPSAAIARDIAVGGRSADLTKIAPGVCMDQSRWPALQGPHNAQNALAAIAACQALGIAQDAIDRGLESFPGLPHRMERVASRNGVTFVNDSKATNPESVAPALAAYDRIHWIVGGAPKTDSLEACRPGFGHVVRAYTIGNAGEMFAGLLEGDVPVERSGTLEAAVQSAAAAAKSGDTVLLSPACASFDQFRDYEHRGQAFRDAVGALK
ncbi:UDP-N-acetylmuramoyl-L-alanine--D-glutamate ligase [Sphingomonas hengshuiensis]|uniref:UDP-N-acetylmuramoylalanine--D-glutamate ligase n=1 Tax=Sphingomonas hengshuiensis TaxID=1609977 RepID=A0A7U4J871_9SPHN|nr:UDP-N-acetylmuramoyl-L-alanine--D-glutamate ligase [Sphingomonas hengshuiensis]AJP72056.1 UDP-N-acetylmuramoylalanine--D-glutamate ligase [Sphingomonas hengshuiensis]